MWLGLCICLLKQLRLYLHHAWVVSRDPQFSVRGTGLYRKLSLSTKRVSGLKGSLFNPPTIVAVVTISDVVGTRLTPIQTLLQSLSHPNDWNPHGSKDSRLTLHRTSTVSTFTSSSFPKTVVTDYIPLRLVRPTRNIKKRERRHKERRKETELK